MKRLIIILVIFSVMMGVTAFELVYLNHVYSHQYDKLSAVAEAFDKDPKNIDNAESVATVEDAYKYWQKHKQNVMMFANHNIARFLDERMVALKELARMNQEFDAYVALKVSMNYIKELKKENLPLLPNML